MYDIANVLFWREERLVPLLRCHKVRCGDVPQWRERLRCYALRIDLQKLHAALTGESPGEVAWLLARCRRLIERE